MEQPKQNWYATKQCPKDGGDPKICQNCTQKCKIIWYTLKAKAKTGK
jgi:hypothetical protein